MRCLTAGIVLIALIVSYEPADARRKGEENWKQRYKNWVAEEDQSRIAGAGALIGTDEASAAKLYREGQNSVYDSPTDEIAEKHRREEEWNRKIEEKKQRLGLGTPEGKPVSEITAWHEEKWRRTSRHHGTPPHDLQRYKRRQPLYVYSEDQEQARNTPKPPPHTKVAEMARYIVHNSDWAAVAYTSRQPETYGLPMADIFSISDGLVNNSTGVPYMYVSPLDTGVQDLAKDSRCSLAMSLAQGDYCRKESLDPEDPRCAHVFLTGKMKTLKNGTEEWARAENFFFTRHPHLRNMPKDHKFRFMKLKISHILVQDYFGGPASPTLAEYFAAKPEDFYSVRSAPATEAEAELLPGASVSEKWVRPIE